MAGVGRSRDICVIRLVDDFIDELAELHDKIDYEYVVRYITPRIFEILKEAKYLKEDDNSMECNYLFAYKDKLFHIMSDGCVFEVTDEIAIGTGDQNAYGSLDSSKGVKDVNKRLIEAVKAACNHNLYVSGSIIISDTKTCEFKEI